MGRASLLWFDLIPVYHGNTVPDSVGVNINWDTDTAGSYMLHRRALVHGLLIIVRVYNRSFVKGGNNTTMSFTFQISSRLSIEWSCIIYIHGS